MELTLASALSPAAFVGHAAYLLLVLSMMMGRMVKLRVLAVASTIVGIVYSGVYVHDPVGLFWKTALCGVNLIQLALIWNRNRLADFTPAERSFVTTRLRGAAPGDARLLLDTGHWVTHPEGTVLTRAGEPVERLRWIADGHVPVCIAGRQVADCGPGNFIGEMALIGEGMASADTITEAPTLVWEVETDRLARFLENRDSIRRALEAGIARDMATKIALANRGTSA